MLLRILAVLLVAALFTLLNACGGSSLERNSSAKGIVVSRPGAGTAHGRIGTLFYFYDNGSSSEAGSIVSWEWDFADGTGWHDATATSGVMPHVFDTDGTHRCRLRVINADGQTDVAEFQIKIND